MKKSIPLRVAGLLGAALALSLFSHPYSGYAYDLTKGFKLTAATPGPSQPKVSTYYYCHVWVNDILTDGSLCLDEQHKPTNQPAIWNPYGRDKEQFNSLNSLAISNIITTNGILTNVVFNTGTDGKSNSVSLARSNIVFQGSNTNRHIRDTAQTGAKKCASKATNAISIDVTLSKVGNTNEVTGTNNVQGAVDLAEGAWRHLGYSFNTAITLAQFTNSAGSSWKTTFLPGSTIDDPPSTNKPKTTYVSGPLQFTVRDQVTGAVTNGTLYTYTMATTASGSGGFSWSNDHVQIAAADMDFSIELPGQFTSLAGHLNLQVRNGLVALSDATGIYTGMLPSVGTPVPLDFPLSNDLDFEFDLSSLIIGTNDTDVFIYISCTGEEYKEYIAGPIPLSLSVVSGSPQLSWPLTARFWQLQKSTNLGPAAVWADVTDPPPVFSNEVFTVTLPPGDNQAFFRLRMLGPFCEVSINQQPQDATDPEGSLVTFSVGASGTPSLLSYQWQEQVVGGFFQDIPNATSPSYSRVMFSSDNGSQFRCLVTNDCEYRVSDPATLTVF